MKKASFLNVILVLVFIVVVFFLSGCGPTLYAVSAINNTKDATAKVEIVEETPLSAASCPFLSEIKSLAVWPDQTEKSVQVANRLEQIPSLTVITPSKVKRSLHSQGVYAPALKHLTHHETLEIFQTVCLHTGADAVVAFKKLGTKAGMKNTWFPATMKTEINTRTEVFIYNFQTKKVFVFVAETKIEMRVKSANPREIAMIFADTIVKKIAAQLSLHEERKVASL